MGWLALDECFRADAVGVTWRRACRQPVGERRCAVENDSHAITVTVSRVRAMLEQAYSRMLVNWLKKRDSSTFFGKDYTQLAQPVGERPGRAIG